MTTSAILTPARTAALLRASMAAVRAEAEALAVKGMRWHPADGEWCTNEVVGHHRGGAPRLRGADRTHP